MACKIGIIYHLVLYRRSLSTPGLQNGKGGHFPPLPLAGMEELLVSESGAQSSSLPSLASVGVQRGEPPSLPKVELRQCPIKDGGGSCPLAYLVRQERFLYRERSCLESFKKIEGQFPW